MVAVAAIEHAGQQEAAAKAYAALLRRWPDDLVAESGLANREHAAGRVHSPESRLCEAVRRYPDSVVVLNNLAQILSDEGRHEEALSLIDRASALGGRFSTTVAQTRDLIVERMKANTHTSASSNAVSH